MNSAKPDSIAIDAQIHVVRGMSELLDSDLASLYKVSVEALLRAARRNQYRFPSNYMFQLTNQKVTNLATTADGIGLGPSPSKVSP